MEHAPILGEQLHSLEMQQISVGAAQAQLVVGAMARRKREWDFAQLGQLAFHGTVIRKGMSVAEWRTTTVLNGAEWC